LLLGLALFAVVVALIDREALGRVGVFLRRRWLGTLALVAVWAGLMALLMAPYREANRGFHRPYAEVLALTPRPASWLASAPQGMWYRWLPKSAREPASELWIFPGAVPLAVAACGLALTVAPRQR